MLIPACSCLCVMQVSSGSRGPRARGQKAKKREAKKGGHHKAGNVTARELLLNIFFFYFAPNFLPESYLSSLDDKAKKATLAASVVNLVRDATNSKGGEEVVRHGVATLKPYDPDVDDEDDSRPRSNNKRVGLASHPLTASELIYFLGSRILMGAHSRPRLSCFWRVSGRGHEADREPTVAAMKEDRHKEILSHLSFMEVGAPDYPNDKLRKLRAVNEVLRTRVQLAWCIEALAVIDESRLRLTSRLCSFVVSMLCKPIKTGITIYCLVLMSGYLYDWSWFLGAGTSAMPMGAPTDTSPLDEDNSEEMKYTMQLVLGLLQNFEGSGATVILDKAFTSIKLARKLASMGIGMIGMLRTAGRPKTKPRAGTDAGWYWPFRGYDERDRATRRRGWRREAFIQLEQAHGKEWWLRAEIWLDSKWVTLLATTFFDASVDSVLRWTKEADARTAVPCSLTLKTYQTLMGLVDRFNRKLADTNMNMGRCKQRYHRALFLGWLLPAVGIGNVRVAFEALCPEDQLKNLKEEASSVGSWDRFFQIWLGEELCKWAEEQAKAELGTREERASSGLAPHWLSQQKQRPPQGHAVKPFPENHIRFQPGKDKKIKVAVPADRHCCRCKEVARRGGVKGWRSGDGSSTDKKVFKMPDGENVPQSSWACSICKRFFCYDCFRMEDDNGNPLPDAWDHDNKRLLCQPCDVVSTG